MILVTGATGCLGSNLTRELLERGEEVAILRRPSDLLGGLVDLAGQVEHRMGDVRDANSLRAAFRDVESVYHLAGITIPLNSVRRLMTDVNVGGTESVARAALRAGVNRMVHVSSTAAIGVPEDDEPASEEFVYNGYRFDHSYMTTKRRGEEVVMKVVDEGLNAVVVNPAATMAPGGSLTYGWAGLLLMIESGRMPVFPKGGLGLVTRRDVVDGMIKAMENGKCGERYILNTRNVTYRELWDVVAAIVGRGTWGKACPDTVLRVVGWWNSSYAWLVRNPESKPMLVRENVPMLLRRLYWDQSKAVRDLGMSQTSLRTAVEETWEWCVRARRA